MTSVIFPSAWEKVELSDVALFQNGYAFKSSTYSEVGDFVIRIGNVQDKGVNLNNPAYVNATKLNAEKFRLSKGDILISLTGNVGRVAIIKEEHLPAVLNQRVAKVIFSSSMVSKFNYYLLRSNVVQSELLKCAKGAAQLNISTKDMDRIIVGIPSVAEQKIIVGKLDTLLAQIDSTKARLEKISKVLNRFRQAVLASAVDGSLTKIWREINNIPNWDVTDWESILRSKKDSFKRGPFGSSLKKSMFVSEGYKVYEQYCPINDDCSYARYFITEEKFDEMKNFEVLDGDFLISCSGVSLGRITQVPKNSEKGIINQALLRVRINNEVYLDDFFILLFRSPIFQKKIFDNSTGSAIPNLKGVKELKAMKIPLLCLNEQHEIVRRVEQLFAYADTIEKQVNNALARVNNLTQSILVKAFRGELTAQWRAENPELISGENSAAALLEKIKAERAASTGKKVARKKS